MTIASNKYAAKLFSEHPIALWPLDDDVSFISMITDSERDLTNWAASNCSTTNDPSLPSQPGQFNSSGYYGIVGDYSAANPDGCIVELRSDPLFMFDTLNQDMTNFSINFYLYQESLYATQYEFGFRYFDTYLGSYKEILSSATPTLSPQWIRFNETFDVPEFDSDTCEIVFKIHLAPGGDVGDYNFIMNGLSVGQWSESTSSKSLGCSIESLPSSSGLSSEYGATADQYGPLSDNAYYLTENGKLLAKNIGVPLVFGSENVTRLYPSNSQLPSLIFPGQGFLSESGRYSPFSVEFWMRIRPNTKNDIRIFGPLDSDYGLYVSEGFLTMLIGEDFVTHNVSEWYRPMLVHIIYNDDNCTLLINGESVGVIEINRSDLTLPLSNEWIGFFADSAIDLFEIDCVSIFPYPIPVQVAKRRFVWGQGVESQQTIDASFKGNTSAIAFSNSGYSSNIIYPDKERWDAAYYNNLVANSSSISVPQYSLPDIYLSGRNKSLWYEANRKVNDIAYPDGGHPKFITFRPGLNEAETEWIRDGVDWTEKCYLEFSSANIESAPISSIYGVFELEDDLEQSRPLIHIVNALSGKRLEINISSYDVSYIFDGNTIYTQDTSGQEHVIVGFHIPTLSDNFGYDISNFFSSYEALQIYVGGAPDTLSNTYNTFEGKIYKIAFSNASNYNEISEHFNLQGFANYEDDSLFIGHYATYSVSPFYRYNRFFLDISVSARWEEYYPLSYFSSYVSPVSGAPYYGLDYMQFNIGYPSLIERIEQIVSSDVWSNYADFESNYAYPVQKSYEILDNENITGYQDYEDLDINQVIQIQLDTSQSSVDIFATFQLIAEGANEPLDNFQYTKELTESLVVDAEQESTISNPYKPYMTKFRIVDGTIIYPPKTISAEDVAIVVHFVINQDGILSNPLRIRNMEITSKALNSVGQNPIGTKFGKNIYPYTKSGIYYNYKEKNPIVINKNTNPYLYLTENSGIKTLMPNEIYKEYGIAFPVNESKQSNFYIAATQIFFKLDFYDQISVPTPLFEIQHNSGTIEFVMESDSSGLRNTIFARDKWTKQIYQDIQFYQNGIDVTSIIVSPGEWNVLGLSFGSPLNFSENTGSINVFHGGLFNNISFYLSEGLNEIASIIQRTWQKVLTEDNVNNLDWQYWYDENGTSAVKSWRDVYVLAEEKTYTLNPQDIFSRYSGTNIEIIDDDSGITVSNDDFSIISDATWSSFVGKPV